MSKDWTILIRIGIITLAFGVFAVLLYMYQSGSQATGELFITMQAKESPVPGENPIPVAVGVDITSGTSRPLLNSGGGVSSIDQHPHTLKGKKSIAFTSLEIPITSKSVSHIYVYNVETKQKRQITHDDLLFKYGPRWAPEGDHIAFYAKNINDGGPPYDVQTVEKFEIYITDLNGETTFIANGMHPRWVANGNALLVLQNDGLHTFNTNGEEIAHIWESEGDTGVLSNTTIAVSADEKKIVWAAPDFGTIDVLEVEQWAPFTSGKQKTIPARGFWPVFSPNGNYIAFYEYNGDDLSQLTRIHLETEARERIKDMRAFVPGSISITDWRK